MPRSKKKDNHDKKQPPISGGQRRKGKRRTRQQDDDQDGDDNEHVYHRKPSKSPRLSQTTDGLKNNVHGSNGNNNNNHNMKKTLDSGKVLKPKTKSKSRNRWKPNNNPTNKKQKNKKVPSIQRSSSTDTSTKSNPSLPGSNDDDDGASGTTNPNAKRRNGKNSSSLASSKSKHLKKKQNHKTHHGQYESSSRRGIDSNEHNQNNNSKQQKQPQKIVLKWDSPYHPVPIKSEESILPLLMQYGQKEHGMFKYQKPHRIQKMKQACNENDIRLDQALSLRRHHIVNSNPLTFNSMPKLGLGSYEDIKASSVLFEESVSLHLTNRNNNQNHASRRHGNAAVPFWNEEEQKEKFYKRCNSNSGRGSNKKILKMPPTPDFLLHSTIQIVKTDARRSYNNNKNNQHHSNNSKMSFDVNWIDAKMFYGASTIHAGTKNAVGSLLGTAKKYVASYGQGAFVFYNGYGDELEKLLLKEGVMVLDASPLDLRQVTTHQRKWCGNNKGEILP